MVIKTQWPAKTLCRSCLATLHAGRTKGNATHTHAIFGVVVSDIFFLREMGEIEREKQTGEQWGCIRTAVYNKRLS